MGVVVLVLSAVLMLVGCAGGAPESAMPSTRLESELQRKRYLILPRPDPATVESDVAAATAEMEAAARRQELIEQATRPAQRPDLDQDVRSGLQGRNLNRPR